MDHDPRKPYHMDETFVRAWQRVWDEYEEGPSPYEDNRNLDDEIIDLDNETRVAYFA